MAPLLPLSVCAVLMALSVKETIGFATRLTCPECFANGSDNNVVFEVNSQEINNINCGAAFTVSFVYYPDGSTTFKQLCTSGYNPLPACTDTPASGDCGCVKKEGDIYTYNYVWPGDTASEGGLFNATLCVSPQKPLNTIVSESCKSIRFLKECECVCGHSNGLIIGLAVGAIVLNVLQLIVFVCRAFCGSDCCSIVPYVVLMALLGGAQLGLIITSGWLACADFSGGPHVYLVVATVLFAIDVVLTAIFFIYSRTRLARRKKLAGFLFFLLSLLAVALLIVAVVFAFIKKPACDCSGCSNCDCAAGIVCKCEVPTLTALVGVFVDFLVVLIVIIKSNV